MPAQLNIFLLPFGALQGLLLLLFFIKKKLYLRGYIFLLLYFGMMLLQITLKIMSKTWLMENWGLLYGVSHFLPLLYGPLIFLFAREVLFNKRLRPADQLHLLRLHHAVIFLMSLHSAKHLNGNLILLLPVFLHFVSSRLLSVKLFSTFVKKAVYDKVFALLVFNFIQRIKL